MDPRTIQNLKTQKAQELGQRQAPAPANIATDSVIGGLRGNQNQKINQLFAHDTQLAQTHFTPQAAPSAPGETVSQPTDRIIDPMIGLRAASTQQRSTAAELADIITQIAQRKDLLDDQYDKEYKAYLADMSKRKDVLNTMVDQLNAAIKMKELESSSSGTSDLSALFNALLGAQGGIDEGIADMSGNAIERSKALQKIAELKAKYGDSLITKEEPGTNKISLSRKRGADELSTLSNQLGAATLASNPKMASEVKAMLDMFAPKKLSAEEQKRELDKQDLITMTSALGKFIEKWKGTNALERLSPANPKGLETMSQLNIMTQNVAKIIERNRLSDSDRTFYLNQMPSWWMSPDQAKAKLQGVINGLSSKIGVDVKEIGSDFEDGNDWESY